MCQVAYIEALRSNEIMRLLRHRFLRLITAAAS